MRKRKRHRKRSPKEHKQTIHRSQENSIEGPAQKSNLNEPWPAHASLSDILMAFHPAFEHPGSKGEQSYPKDSAGAHPDDFYFEFFF
jgi:hypothetical protein